MKLPKPQKPSKSEILDIAIALALFAVAFGLILLAVRLAVN